MSSFIKKLKHPETGEMQRALCVDDYYANHVYGYGFRKDGKDADWETTNFDDCDFFREVEEGTLVPEERKECPHKCTNVTPLNDGTCDYVKRCSSCSLIIKHWTRDEIQELLLQRLTF